MTNCEGRMCHRHCCPHCVRVLPRSSNGLSFRSYEVTLSNGSRLEAPEKQAARRHVALHRGLPNLAALTSPRPHRL